MLTYDDLKISMMTTHGNVPFSMGKALLRGGKGELYPLGSIL